MYILTDSEREEARKIAIEYFGGVLPTGSGNIPRKYMEGKSMLDCSTNKLTLREQSMRKKIAAQEKEIASLRHKVEELTQIIHSSIKTADGMMAYDGMPLYRKDLLDQNLIMDSVAELHAYYITQDGLHVSDSIEKFYGHLGSLE